MSPSAQAYIMDLLGSAHDADVEVRAFLRIGGVTAPCQILDLGVGGLCVRNDGGVSDAELQSGTKLVLSVIPNDGYVRADIPVEVRERDNSSGTYWLRATGRPLVVRQRRVRDQELDDALGTEERAPQRATKRTLPMVA